MRIFGVSALAATLCAGVAAASSGVVEHIYRFAPDGTTCLGCSESAPIEDLRRAIEVQRATNFARWLQGHVSAGDSFSHSLFRTEPEAQVLDAFSRLVGDPSGWSFVEDSTELRYRQVSCLLFDCYKYYMTLLRPRKRTIWHGRVPPLEIPVCPFVTNRGIMYLGTGRTGISLVILDTLDGHKVGEFELQKGPEGLVLQSAFRMTPVFVDPYVVFQSFREVAPPPGAKGSSFVPSEFIVIRLRT